MSSNIEQVKDENEMSTTMTDARNSELSAESMLSSSAASETSASTTMIGKTSSKSSVAETIPEVPGSLSDYECKICRDNVADGDRVQLRPCNHEFHKRCADTWAETNSNCAYCRTPVDEIASEYANGVYGEVKAMERPSLANAFRGIVNVRIVPNSDVYLMATDLGYRVLNNESESYSIMNEDMSVLIVLPNTSTFVPSLHDTSTINDEDGNSHLLLVARRTIDIWNTALSDPTVRTISDAFERFAANWLASNQGIPDSEQGDEENVDPDNQNSPSHASSEEEEVLPLPTPPTPRRPPNRRGRRRNQIELTEPGSNRQSVRRVRLSRNQRVGSTTSRGRRSQTDVTEPGLSRQTGRRVRKRAPRPQNRRAGPTTTRTRRSRLITPNVAPSRRGTRPNTRRTNCITQGRRASTRQQHRVSRQRRSLA